MSSSAQNTSWSICRIEECLAGCFPGEWGTSPSEGGNATVLRATDIDDDGHIISSGVPRQIPADKLAWKRLIQGDILLEASGGGPDKPVGRVAIFNMAAGDAFVCSNFFRTLRPDTAKVHPSFLCARLLHLHSTPQIWHFQQQTTGIINLKIPDYLSANINLPPYDEQREIGNILEVVDKIIQRTEQLVEKLKLAKQGLLNDLLTRGVDDNGELRDPIRHPEQFKDSPLGRIPKPWNIAPLAEFGNPTRPHLKTGPFGSSLKQEHWTKEGTPVVTIGSLGDGEFLRPYLLFVSAVTAASLSGYALEQGDIVFSRVADVGRSVVVSADEQGWIMSSNMMWISVDPARSHAHFVQANIGGNRQVRRQISKLVNSSGRDVANASIMNLLLLPWPSKDEQGNIINHLAKFRARQMAEIEALEKLRVLKQALMEDLLTGRVRVTSLLEKAHTQ